MLPRRVPKVLKDSGIIASNILHLIFFGRFNCSGRFPYRLLLCLMNCAVESFS